MTKSFKVAVATGVCLAVLPVAPAQATDCRANAFTPAPSFFNIEFGGLVVCPQGHALKSQRLQIRFKEDRPWPLRDRTLYSSGWHLRSAYGTHVLSKKMLCSTIRDLTEKRRPYVYSQIVAVEVNGDSATSDASGNYQAC